MALFSFARSVTFVTAFALAVPHGTAALSAEGSPAPENGIVTLVESFAAPQPTPSASARHVTAIGMRAEVLPTSTAAADVVLLVDTSASQAGDFRARSFDVVRGLFAGARPGDRVLIAAVDSFFLALSDSFAAPDEHHLGDSLGRLEQRTPLGASDVIAGLRAATNLFADSERTKAIVYIGDGPSWAGVDAVDFAEVVDLLRIRRIPVSVAGLGPEVNWPLLAALANQTGGVMIVPAPHESAADVGRALATQAVQPVAWPVDRDPGHPESAERDRVLPTRLPPLRADRESVVLIGGERAPVEVEFAFESPSGERFPVRVLVPDVASKYANAFLAELFDNASPTDGLFLPLLGSQGLEAAREFLLGEARTLAELSRQADDAGMQDSALRLAEASLRRDPDNPVAKRVRTVALQAVAAPADARAEEVAPPARIEEAREDATADDLGELAQMRRVRGQQLEQEAAVRIREARRLLSSDPDGARSLLQRTLNEVRDSVDLDPAARERLGRQLEMTIRESIVRSREKMDRDIAAERRAAIGRENARLADSLRRREERLKQLVERYNALVDQGIRDGYAGSERYPKSLSNEGAEGYEMPTRALTEAERHLGDEIGREAPQMWAGHPIPMPAREIGRTAGLVARTLDYDAENFRTRRDQERGFMDTLHLVDVAAIPLPDEPSIIYPTASRWREINALRAEYRKPALNTLNANEQKVYDALDKPVLGNFTFEERSLTDLAAVIQDQFGISVVLDNASIVDDRGLDINEGIVTRKPGAASLRSALRQILDPLELTYMIKNEALVILTKDAAVLPQNMIVRPYAVGDLVLPVDPSNPINPFNLGGQNPQQQNQPINPQPPGPLCWVAREVYGPHDPRWLIVRDWVLRDAPTWLRDAYAAHGETLAEWIHDKPVVKWGVRCGMDAVVSRHRSRSDLRNAQWQVAAVQGRLEGGADSESAADRSVIGNDRDGHLPRKADRVHQSGVGAGLPAEILNSDDIAAALRSYLAPAAVAGDGAAYNLPDATPLQARLAQVRVSAAALGKAGQFRKASELISAAIRTGHAEPWMYESLALAMEAAGGSRTEITRALLSTEDFAKTSADLLTLANFLARMDFGDKALDLCKKVCRIEPANGDAFALAMTIASRHDDLNALAWACPGVLAIDWPAKHKDIAVRAARLAKTTIRQFEETGRQAEADGLRSAVETASVRDIVIRFAWSGDAEVDVLVEEPPGTLCGSEVPRTTSGGTLVGTDTSESGAPAHQRCYSAAFAFPGTYRIRLRRLFGTIEADSVEVAITAHRGTPAERTDTRRIPLSSSDHLLQVELGEGRRQQALSQAQLAQDVVVQRGISKAVLMQQLELLASDEVQSEFASSRSGVVGPSPVGNVPFFGKGGTVGYQPVITTLPEGVNLKVRAVVSADRRYVRITAAPLFSGIGQVSTFNYVSGASGGGQQGGIGGQQGGIGGQQGGIGGQQGFGQGGIGGQQGFGQGGIGGQQGFGGFCWVAREVYGPGDPRWLLFRGWLLSDAPVWLRETYIAHGEAFAEWLRDKPAAKAAVRSLMDRVVAGRPLQAAGR